MRKWPKITHFCHKNGQFFFSKKAAQRLWNILQGMFGPNFSSKASVTFSNCGGRREKMKCLKTAKTQKIALFDRKIAYFNHFCPCCGKYFIMQLKYITTGMIYKN